MKRIFYVAVAACSIVFLSPLNVMAQQCHRGWNNSIARDDLRMLDYEQIPTVEAFCQALRASNWCGEGCEESAGLRRLFDEVKAEREARQVEQEQKKVREKAQASALAIREAAMRARTSVPENLGEAVIYYEAEHGGQLASAPKIKPDGGMYYVHGKIKMAGESPEFLAALSSSKDNELLANALRRSRGLGESTDYFAVVIPDQLQNYYFDKAKIEGGFDLVGRYVSNTKYTTVSGQEKSAPVFEAVYFKVW
ncbi:hypothetical protein EYC51_15745 [Alcaligenes faecalis]|nr:hypothetical protein EYC51_15745 [Alcaligenes faecalis]